MTADKNMEELQKLADATAEARKRTAPYYDLERRFCEIPEVEDAVERLYMEVIRLIGSAGDHDTKIDRELISRCLLVEALFGDAYRFDRLDAPERDRPNHVADRQWLETVSEICERKR